MDVLEVTLGGCDGGYTWWTFQRLHFVDVIEVRGYTSVDVIEVTCYTWWMWWMVRGYTWWM